MQKHKLRKLYNHDEAHFVGSQLLKTVKHPIQNASFWLFFMFQIQIQRNDNCKFLIYLTYIQAQLMKRWEKLISIWLDKGKIKKELNVCKKIRIPLNYAITQLKKTIKTRAKLKSMSKQPHRALHGNSQQFQNGNHLPQSTQHIDFYMLRINLRNKKK